MNSIHGIPDRYQRGSRNGVRDNCVIGLRAIHPESTKAIEMVIPEFFPTLEEFTDRDKLIDFTFPNRIKISRTRQKYALTVFIFYFEILLL